VVPLLERGKIRVPVASTFPMEQAAEAYRRQAAGGKLGKIVLLGGIKGS
jgi:NADPH:quinone reductase-like Zn-dependent oxidoreductase